MPVLDQIRRDIYRGFRGKLLRGTLRRPQGAISGGLDALGDPIAVDVLQWSCQGFLDDYSDIFRAQAGIPLTDVKVQIFGASLPPGIAPQKDDQALFSGAWYQLRAVRTDPATALWTCQAYAISAPA